MEMSDFENSERSGKGKKPVPVRLSEEMISRLDAAAEGLGCNRAALIRMLLCSWIAAFEKEAGGALPGDWRKIMAGDDDGDGGDVMG